MPHHRWTKGDIVQGAPKGREFGEKTTDAAEIKQQHKRPRPIGVVTSINQGSS
jgi:hypothetical protein